MSKISTLFTSLIAEAIGLPPDAFGKFFDEDQQHKLKIVKYPEVDVPDLPADASPLDRKKWEIKRQGVGPHKDSMLTSYLLQASDQPGLQAQNARGEWVDCKPIAGTLVVAIGQGMEALTDGVCASTTHRVLSPRKGDGPRYSVPFFQGVSYDAEFEAMDVPAEVLALRDEARKARHDDVEFTFVKGRWGHLGEATLMNRVKSHPDVGERWVSVIYSSSLFPFHFLSVSTESETKRPNRRETILHIAVLLHKHGTARTVLFSHVSVVCCNLQKDSNVGITRREDGDHSPSIHKPCRSFTLPTLGSPVCLTLPCHITSHAASCFEIRLCFDALC